MITITKLGENNLEEFKLLLSLFNDVFENGSETVPGDRYLTDLLKRENFIVYAAFNNLKLIGGLTAFVLPQYYYESSSVYLYDLAVAVSHQRNGVGKLLMEALNAYCKNHNLKEVFVQTERDEQTAISFYRSTGGKELDVKHFTYHLSSM